ncbi:restriction endonuclease subunit S [Methylicorpusculum oleiharenae]|uniref:restriction endonuclease subunit S n=1 Tax=Methylicorpusculum oleiharenae TaxID=1338687 RepID=UPI00135684BC|nr:restriction endonuclease subunit S [Methylicorpusculum oleiharenae]MCD2453818.1 restriction endonuclease subunit S [Methylicorpusculum oleiharenae]
MKWKQITLGEILRVKHGWAFKSEHFSDVGQHIVLTPGNFYEEGGFKARGDKDRFYSGDYPSEYLLSKGNVIVAMTEQGEGLLGSAAIIPENDRFLHNQRLGLVTIKNDAEADLFFVYKLFNTQIVRQQISGSASGAKVKHTAPERIYKCKVELPPLHLQRNIAAILSAYDYLIENNLTRIKLLEEMAQITYEEWFVRLKFPGHETTPLDSATGLPVGWKKEKLGNVTSYINRGVSPDYVENDGFCVINQKCIRNHYVNLEEARLTSKAKRIPDDKLINKLDILINSTGTGTLGRVAQIFATPGFATVDSHVTIVRASTPIFALYLGRALEHIESFIENLGKGATNQQELSRTDLAELIKVVVPTKDVLIKYDEFSSPIYESISMYQSQNQLLKEARDILLPRLMTGMIDVEQLVLPESFSNLSASTQVPQTV